MARYIDADALKLDLDMSQGARITDFALAVIRSVKNAPTADVAPRTEVAREIFAEMDKVLLPVMNSIYPVEVYIKLKKKHLAATGTNDSGKDMI